MNRTTFMSRGLPLSLQGKKMKSPGNFASIGMVLAMSIFITYTSSSIAATPLFFPTKNIGISRLNETKSESPVLEEDYISYYDQNCQQETGIGLTNGGTFEGAIRITPTELTGYESWNLCAARVLIAHDDMTNLQGTLKIYAQGTPTQPGTLLASEHYIESGGGWVRVNLSKPISLDTTKDLWVSFEITHAAGQHPLIADEGPAHDGKGDWVGHNGSWTELQTVDSAFDLNWVIEAIITNTGSSQTELQITTISGSPYGLSMKVKNTGNFEAVNTTMNLTVKGGFFGLINKKSITQIPSIAVGAIAGSYLRLFGLGKIFISIKVETSNANSVVKTTTGILLGPFVFCSK